MNRTVKALPWVMIVLWAALVAGALPLAAKLDGVKSDSVVDYLPSSAQSTQVTELETKLPRGHDYEFVIVYVRGSGLTQADKDTARRHLDTLVAKFGKPGVPPPNEGKVDLSPDGKAAFTIASVPVERGVPSSYIEDFRAVVSDRPVGLDVKVTGPGGIEADIDTVFDGIDETLLIAAAVVVAVILVLTYRSPLLWLIPLLCAGAAVVVSQAGTYLLVEAFGLTVSDQNSAILIILVFGVATDYALLLVARYREELRRHQQPRIAMGIAWRRSAPAVAASAATVIAGLMCLLAADMNSLKGLGPIATVAILCALAAMLTLFPAVLVLLGRPAFWPRIPRDGDRGPSTYNLWSRIGDLVSRRRIPAVAGSLALLGVMALGLLTPVGPLRQMDQFVNKPESISGLQLIPAHFPDLGGQPLIVIGKADTGDRLRAAAQGTPGVSQITKGQIGNGLIEFAVLLRDKPDTPAEYAAIEALRTRLAAVDPSARVGGPSAQNLDTVKAAAADERKLIPLILLAVSLVLGLLLRSIVAPLVLIATVVISFAAALGVMTFLFVQVLGLPGLDPTLITLGFLFLVALGVDYNIFLMTRAREESALTGTSRGVVAALVTTGGVITSAGVVLAATFGAMATLPLVFMIELGLLVAFGVLLDTLLVRSILVPGLALLLGSRIWWPTLPVPVSTTPSPTAERPVNASSP
ncbi:MMPL family transporter [Nonomuraea sp. SYSU D8015]|uniref:MMPL family transporter n=1 Tax=Nonomuraea sp. SYSU D8015 TaxID=2593644 RepID=UPI0016606B48|nr:MMPL family transporter [Nonomuraea sp. SYSU D8015]